MLATIINIIVIVFRKIWNDIELKTYTPGKWKTNFMVMIRIRMVVIVIVFPQNIPTFDPLA